MITRSLRKDCRRRSDSQSNPLGLRWTIWDDRQSQHIGSLDNRNAIPHTSLVWEGFRRKFLDGRRHYIVSCCCHCGIGRRSGLCLLVVCVWLILAIYRVQGVVDGEVHHRVGT